jgi:allophanate hydrolase subunit 2
MGGYPKIGSVLSVDIGKLAQLSAGGRVNFEAISIEQAQSLLAENENQFVSKQLLKLCL